MRNLFLILLATIIFSSCSLTKRRYMPGYSLEWGHKALKTSVAQSPFHLHPGSVHNQPEKIIAGEQNKQNGTLNHVEKKETTNFPNLIGSTKKTPATSLLIAKEPFLFNPLVLPDDTSKVHFFTGDEQGDDHARYSLTFGILSFAIPAVMYMVLFVIAISSGGSFSATLTIAIALFLLGILVGLFFSVMAYIQGNKAIKEINADPDIYEGKGKAIWGMVLASILPILMIIYLIIKH